MKQWLRRMHRRLQPETHVRNAARQLARPMGNPVRSAQLETAATASMRLMRHQLQRLLGEETRLTTHRVEEKYDHLAGSYLQDQLQDPDRRELVWLDGRLQRVSRNTYYHHNYNERARWIGAWHPSSILEVGAGELTTLSAILDRLHGPIEAHAIDLSFPRIRQGADYFREHAPTLDIQASRAHAQRLPYRDNAFDVVFTSHCLEHMPLTFTDAIDEALRVARRAAIFFEPSFERGSLLQKWRMASNGYARGIEAALQKRSDATLQSAHLLETARPFNRTAVFVVTPSPNPASRLHGPHRVCPTCQGRLRTGPNLWRCPRCQLAFPVVDAIPDLGVDNAYSLASPAAASHSD